MDNISFYEALLNNIPIGIFTVDKKWQITFFNREAERITGFTRKEAIGKRCYEIFRTELCYGNCYLKKALKDGICKGDIRNIIFNKHNKEVPVLITVAPILNSAGKIIGGFESFLDNTIQVQLEKQLTENYTCQDIIGKNEKILTILKNLSKISHTDIPVLITGETGVGKDLFARVIHNTSKRHSKPFIKVNCAALPSSLIESELFGYKKGAFTDAKDDKSGRFEEAHGGTLLLDEIGDLPIELQGKLLQVLDEKTFYPLGSNKPKTVDVRIISLTNRDLQILIEKRLFREDLYHRLNGFTINIPPLRERKDDLPLLIDYFLKFFSKIYGKDIQSIDKNAMKILLDYTYPGNARELKNILEHAVILCSSNTIVLDDLPLNLKETMCYKKMFPKQFISDGIIYTNEKDMILSFLNQFAWNREKVASALKINRTTLWRKMKKYGLLQK